MWTGVAAWVGPVRASGQLHLNGVPTSPEGRLSSAHAEPGQGPGCSRRQRQNRPARRAAGTALEVASDAAAQRCTLQTGIAVARLRPAVGSQPLDGGPAGLLSGCVTC